MTRFGRTRTNIFKNINSHNSPILPIVFVILSNIISDVAIEPHIFSDNGSDSAAPYICVIFKRSDGMGFTEKKSLKNTLTLSLEVNDSLFVNKILCDESTRFNS